MQSAPKSVACGPPLANIGQRNKITLESAGSTPAGPSLAAKVYFPELFLDKVARGALGGDGVDERFMRYAQTKLSQALMAMELHRRLQARRNHRHNEGR